MLSSSGSGGLEIVHPCALSSSHLQKKIGWARSFGSNLTALVVCAARRVRTHWCTHYGVDSADACMGASQEETADTRSLHLSDSLLRN